MDPNLQAIYDAILEGNQTAARAGVQAALEATLAPETILNQAMIAAMQQVGKLFEEGEYYVPEMLISARAMQAGLALLKPLLQKDQVKSSGKVLIGTVKGDLHDIGKNLVSIMLEGSGFEVIDLGADVAPQKFVEALQQEHADIVALSALLTTTMPQMQTTLQALETAGLRQQVKVIVGGAPVTEGFARQIGADGYAPDASRAAALARALLQERV
jgi:5-methyltetrahydrofolate--homocysteine methyltransferase